MILTLVHNYVTKQHPYANGFVHSRLKEYRQNDVDVVVFVLGKHRKPSYDIDEIHVEVGNHNDLIKYIYTRDIDTICIHFLNYKMVKAINKIDKKLNLFIFIHGNEALWWYQRIFKGTFASVHSSLAFIKYAIFNVYSIYIIRNFLKSTSNNITFITVSEWMKKIAIKNLKIPASKNFFIVPNIIDKNLFKYCEKKEIARMNILSIRPFSSGKYANDISVNVIKKLSSYPNVFDKLNFTIIGDGILFDKLLKPISHYKNVNIIKGLLDQNSIPRYHEENGIFLCPTRQDAQGVSMCEAMCSGLVPITLENTAIPEFVPQSLGILCESEDDMVQLILKLYHQPKLFTQLSSEVSSFIQVKCSYKNTVAKEISLIKDC